LIKERERNLAKINNRDEQKADQNDLKPSSQALEFVYH